MVFQFYGGALDPTATPGHGNGLRGHPILAGASFMPVRIIRLSERL